MQGIWEESTYLEASWAMGLSIEGGRQRARSGRNGEDAERRRLSQRSSRSGVERTWRGCALGLGGRQRSARSPHSQATVVVSWRGIVRARIRKTMEIEGEVESKDAGGRYGQPARWR